MNLYEKAKAGLPIDDFQIIDEHCHMGTFASHFAKDNGSPEAIIKVMNRLGISKAIVSHSMSLVADFEMGNDIIIKAMDQYPDRFLGYCTVNPLYPEELKQELERCFKYPGFRGIKLHPYCHERSLFYKHYRPVYEFAARNRLFVMSHTYTGEDVAATDYLAGEFPEAIFIMGHTGGEKYNVEKALEVIGRHGNVYGDIAVSQSLEGVIEWYVKEVGAKKILFGTDMPCMSGEATLALVAMAEISDDEKMDILGRNMQKILDKSY